MANGKPELEVVHAFVAWLLSIGYTRDDFRENFPIQMASKSAEVDIAIFCRGVAGDRYQQKHIFMIVEAKRRDITERKYAAARRQLESYMSACANTMFGIVRAREWGSQSIRLDAV